MLICICFNLNKSPTRCNSFSSLLLDVYFQLNMFRASLRPSSRAQQLHNHQHCYHHAPKVKPEAATAAVELLMIDLFELYDDARTCKL
jgi:hypothetical protein